jgi:hypothetical protein
VTAAGPFHARVPAWANGKYLQTFEIRQRDRAISNS